MRINFRTFLPKDFWLEIYDSKLFGSLMRWPQRACFCKFWSIWTVRHGDAALYQPLSAMSTSFHLRFVRNYLWTNLNFLRSDLNLYTYGSLRDSVSLFKDLLESLYLFRHLSFCSLNYGSVGSVIGIVKRNRGSIFVGYETAKLVLGKWVSAGGLPWGQCWLALTG